MKDNNIEDSSETGSKADDLQGRLTPRENEVVKWILEGKSNSAIAKELGISVRTVEKHCESIYRKLGVDNRCATIVMAARHNWKFE